MRIPIRSLALFWLMNRLRRRSGGGRRGFFRSRL